MHDQASATALSGLQDGGAARQAVAEAVAKVEAAFRELSGALRWLEETPPVSAHGDDGFPPLLSPGQVAELTGLSRNTVDRMTAEGKLPAVTLRAGARQRMVRIPKAFVVRMLADLNAGRSIVSLRDYATAWQASASAQPVPAGHAGRAEDAA